MEPLLLVRPDSAPHEVEECKLHFEREKVDGREQSLQASRHKHFLLVSSDRCQNDSSCLVGFGDRYQPIKSGCRLFGKPGVHGKGVNLKMADASLRSIGISRSGWNKEINFLSSIKGHNKPVFGCALSYLLNMGIF